MESDEGFDIERVLEAATAGDGAARERLVAVLYHELRHLAGRLLAREEGARTLQPTALVHEAWLRLADDRGVATKGRAYFFAAAARAMRRILVERARQRGRLRHGGGFERQELEDFMGAIDPDSERILALDVALARLARKDERLGRLVELRYFAGASIPEAAAALEISVATANRDWAFAKVWLYDEMRAELDGAGS